MRGALLPDYDVLNIPKAMGEFPVIMMGIAGCLFGLFFVISILSENIKAAGGEDPNFRSIFKRSLLVLCGLVLYKHIFLKIVAFCEVISMSFFNIKDVDSLIDTMLKTYDTIPIGLMSLTVPNAIAAFFVYIATIIESALLLFRYILLAGCYTFGPLAFVCGLWKPLSSFTSSWFKTVFQISFWIITLRVFEATMLSLGVSSFIQNGGTIEYILYSFLLICLVALTPKITSAILSGESLGIIGGAALALGYNIATNWSKKGFKMGTSKPAAQIYQSTWQGLKSGGRFLSTLFNKTSGIIKNQDQLNKKEPKR